MSNLDMRDNGVAHPAHDHASRYLRRSAAAAYVNSITGECTKATLAKLATVGGGPVYRKIGKFPVYLPEDLDRWIESRVSKPVSSTSEYAAA